MGEMADLELERAELYDWDECKSLSYGALSLIEIGFWRDKQGSLHKIDAMQTSHLNNLVKMLERQDFDIPLRLEVELEFRKQAQPSRDSE